jgi:hypothetical protein
VQRIATVGWSGGGRTMSYVGRYTYDGSPTYRLCASEKMSGLFSPPRFWPSIHDEQQLLQSVTHLRAAVRRSMIGSTLDFLLLQPSPSQYSGRSERRPAATRTTVTRPSIQVAARVGPLPIPFHVRVVGVETSRERFAGLGNLEVALTTVVHFDCEDGDATIQAHLCIEWPERSIFRCGVVRE